MLRKRLLIVGFWTLLLVPAMLASAAALAAPPPPAKSPSAIGAAVVSPGCAACHNKEETAWLTSRHNTVSCETCHEGSAAHKVDGTAATRPKVHWDMESCASCHADQYNSFQEDHPGRTYFGPNDPGYGGSDAGPNAPEGWSKTSDLPYWNAIISGHPFVQETYEDRGMKWNQIDAQETIRPKSEACLECHGTKVAYYMGITYRDATGAVVTIPPKVGVTTASRTISTGTTSKNPTTGAWDKGLITITVPAGTRISTFTDAVSPQYQVKTVLTLPAPTTVTLSDGRSLTFQTAASHGLHGQVADISGADTSDMPKAAAAKNWIYAALQALAFDGLDYTIADPVNHPFEGSGPNWPSVQAGELCNQCHDPHSGKLRIIRKALIEGIAREGINPYDPAKKSIKRFEDASRQDKIIAVCAQCHSEYVGGYSANTGLDQDFFPWGKVGRTEQLYTLLFNYQQDWTHGAPVQPWQSMNPNDRGYVPPEVPPSLLSIGETLVKSQHPEAEVFLGSRMYKEGATCTDCHSARITRPDGTKYTSHYFASPIKWVDFKGIVPCQKCHSTMTGNQMKLKMKDVQGRIYYEQDTAQRALVNSLGAISRMKAQNPADPRIAASADLHKQAHIRWEYYAQAENSMGFHNKDETVRELSRARALASKASDTPLPPMRLRVLDTTSSSVTLAWYDQARNETEFVLERQDPATPGSGFVEIARLPRAYSASVGDVAYLISGLPAGTAHNYRVAANNANTTLLIFTQPIAASTLPAPPGAGGVEPGPIRVTDVTSTIGSQPAATPTASPMASPTAVPTPTATAVPPTAVPTSTPAPSKTPVPPTATPATAPAAPSRLVATVGPGAVALTWVDNSSNELGFYIERSPNGTTGWTRVGKTGSNLTVFKNTGLASNTTYYYRVQAFGAGGTSAYSSAISATTAP